VSVAIHSTELGTSGSRVAFLHGLFGQGKNWTGIAKALRESCRITLLDLPNHGRSGWTERFSYPETALQIGSELANASPDPVNLVGHSLGGKVAMVLALLQPDLVERLCVVDVAPVRYQTESTFADYVRGLRSVDLDGLPDRATADAVLRPYVPDDVVRGFLLQNLRRDQGPDGPRWRWQLNLDLLGDRLAEIGDWPDLQTPPYEKPVLWVAGANSRYILPEHADTMRRLFPRVRLVTVKNAGHWVHSEQPEIFLAILRRFLQV
jgi:pimeloyl-ACP methyl ester carboxylesterase